MKNYLHPVTKSSATQYRAFISSMVERQTRRTEKAHLVPSVKQPTYYSVVIVHAGSL